MSSDFTLESFTVETSDAVKLRTRLFKPGPNINIKDENFAIVLVHPYSVLGGSQGLLKGIASGLALNGYTAVTFDMRGVGKSTGRPSLTGFAEIKDVVSVSNWVSHSLSISKILLIGSSAGAPIAGSAVDKIEQVIGYVSIGYPFGITASILFGRHHKGILQSLKPKFFIMGTEDGFTSVKQLKNKVKSAAGRAETHLIDGVGHFQMEGPDYDAYMVDLIAEVMGLDPRDVDVPVVGGHAGVTILPLLSQVKPPSSFTTKEIEYLTDRIQNGGTEVVEAKAGAGSATLSMAYAAVKFADACLRALKGEAGIIQCACVDSQGMYIDWCLERLVRHFTAPKHAIDFLKNENGVDRKNKVLSRVHAALKQIADLMPLAPMRLTSIVVQNIPKRYDVTEHEVVMYVENMLKLESGAIGEIVGSTMLPALVDKLIELDVEIEWDGKMHEDAKCIFEMELLEDIAEFADDDEKYYSMCASELLNRNNLQGKKVVEKLDNLIVLFFLHLESCQSSGRLTEVFDILLKSFKGTVLNAYKSKFTQFVMFYACALDPEQCGVKFAMVLGGMFESEVNPPITRMGAVAYLASYLSRAKFLSSALVVDIIQRLVDSCFKYCKAHDLYMNPQAHQVFYSGCQAIMYILCFRMKSLMGVPRLRKQLITMPMLPLWEHKLNPLKVCLPSVVEEFLKQAKAARLFMSAELFIFEDLLEPDLSQAFGGIDRLDMFFPFDPCLLKKSESYIRPHFVRWSRVKTTYGDNFVDRNANDMIDNDMVGSVGAGLDFVNEWPLAKKPRLEQNVHHTQINQICV